MIQIVHPLRLVRPSVLVVGRRGRGFVEAADGGLSGGITLCAFGALAQALRRDAPPEIVLSPLFGEGFDALDLALRLQELDYDGRYRAVAERLPDPGLIRREIRSAAPRVDFDLTTAADLFLG